MANQWISRNLNSLKKLKPKCLSYFCKMDLEPLKMLFLVFNEKSGERTILLFT